MGLPEMIFLGRSRSMEDKWLSADEKNIDFGVTKDTVYEWFSERDLQRIEWVDCGNSKMRTWIYAACNS